MAVIAEEKEEKSAKGITPGHGETLLVVDDDHDGSRVYHLLVRRHIQPSECS